MSRSRSPNQNQSSQLQWRCLHLCSLHDTGRGPAPEYDIREDAVRLHLEAGVPVKLEAEAGGARQSP